MERCLFIAPVFISYSTCRDYGIFHFGSDRPAIFDFIEAVVPASYRTGMDFGSYIVWIERTDHSVAGPVFYNPFYSDGRVV